jgi:hypothetical protein
LEDRTILHELIHAATMGATRVGNLQRAKGTRVAKNVLELYDVAKAVFKQVDAKAARGETLSKTEERLRTNYMRDADEILAWTLTDRDMQAYMETVPYKGTKKQVLEKAKNDRSLWVSLLKSYFPSIYDQFTSAMRRGENPNPDWIHSHFAF